MENPDRKAIGYFGWQAEMALARAQHRVPDFPSTFWGSRIDQALVLRRAQEEEAAAAAERARFHQPEPPTSDMVRFQMAGLNIDGNPLAPPETVFEAHPHRKRDQSLQGSDSDHSGREFKSATRQRSREHRGFRNKPSGRRK